MRNVEEFLAHYASKYYDPVKAHQYYMENRELTGRKSSNTAEVERQGLDLFNQKFRGSTKDSKTKGTKRSGLSDAQKEKWAQTKDQLTAEKNLKVAGERSTNNMEIEAFRSEATAKRTEIADKLKELAKRLSGNMEANLARASEMTQFKIDNLPPIPKGITGEQRDKLVEARNKKIAAIQKTGNSKINDIKSSKENSEKLAQQKEQIATDLKAKIEEARLKFAGIREGINVEYKQKSRDAYNKIKSGG